ncbi:MAG TPA: hypothetical protein VID73_05175 [Ktedonobacterales bacterium]
MSEYQRYEWMTGERALTREQLTAVSRLSSHIEATSTHAVIEYHWGDFKHDPIVVLRDYFDGFLYWANWGAPELALRFPPGVLPSTLLDGYDFDELVTYTRHADHDILDIHFGELEGPDEWVEYELAPLMALREELMDGDPRPLYLVWLASQELRGITDTEEYALDVPAVPPGMGKLTAAQEALAELLQVPDALLAAAKRHSHAAPPAPALEDVAALVEQLPPERRSAYLVRLARQEPGLGRLLARELRELSQRQPEARVATGATEPAAERVQFGILFTESTAIREADERAARERERAARERHLRQVHDEPAAHWERIEAAVERGSGAGYDQAADLLDELRTVAGHFAEAQQFSLLFRDWVRPHLRRPAFVKRLKDRRFPLPEG